MRLNFQRMLADTTAKSYASVKRTDHIDDLRFASGLNAWGGAEPSFKRWTPKID